MYKHMTMMVVGVLLALSGCVEPAEACTLDDAGTDGAAPSGWRCTGTFEVEGSGTRYVVMNLAAETYTALDGEDELRLAVRPALVFEGCAFEMSTANGHAWATGGFDLELPAWSFDETDPACAGIVPFDATDLEPPRVWRSTDTDTHFMIDRFRARTTTGDRINIVVTCLPGT